MVHPMYQQKRDARNFKEYEFTADDLPEFSAFVVKIVGQGDKYINSTIGICI